MESYGYRDLDMLFNLGRDWDEPTPAAHGTFFTTGKLFPKNNKSQEVMVFLWWDSVFGVGEFNKIMDTPR